jgi:hypothetical protein
VRKQKDVGDLRECGEQPRHEDRREDGIVEDHVVLAPNWEQAPIDGHGKRICAGRTMYASASPAASGRVLTRKYRLIKLPSFNNQRRMVKSRNIAQVSAAEALCANAAQLRPSRAVPEACRALGTHAERSASICSVCAGEPLDACLLAAPQRGRTRLPAPAQPLRRPVRCCTRRSDARYRAEASA